jgi:hypothetical protein
MAPLRVVRYLFGSPTRVFIDKSGRGRSDPRTSSSPRAVVRCRSRPLHLGQYRDVHDAVLSPAVAARYAVREFSLDQRLELSPRAESSADPRHAFFRHRRWVIGVFRNHGSILDQLSLRLRTIRAVRS